MMELEAALKVTTNALDDLSLDLSEALGQLQQEIIRQRNRIRDQEQTIATQARIIESWESRSKADVRFIETLKADNRVLRLAMSQ